MTRLTSRPASAALAILALCILIGAGAYASTPACSASGGSQDAGSAKSATQAGVTYTCPMHPEVTSDKAGKCPKCGMFLEAKATERTIYACPMHPDVASDKPGKCPKCGMNLEKKTVKTEFTYTCPMHPDVKSDKPGKCPKCGMFLEAVPKAAADAGHSH